MFLYTIILNSFADMNMVQIEATLQGKYAQVVQNNKCMSATYEFIDTQNSNVSILKQSDPAFPMFDTTKIYTRVEGVFKYKLKGSEGSWEGHFELKLDPELQVPVITETVYMPYDPEHDYKREVIKGNPIPLYKCN